VKIPFTIEMKRSKMWEVLPFIQSNPIIKAYGFETKVMD
jgi:hypothetical protein